MTEAAQTAVKEKVIRVILATFRVCPPYYPESILKQFYQNLVSKAPESNLPAMLVVKLLPFVKNLSTRKWTDDDIVEDIQYLREELAENFRSLTYVH
jgi:V-type H+-transporting ATPase subunit H